MAITAVLYFTDFYNVTVKGYSPSNAGIKLLYYTPRIGIGVYLSMIFCNFYPRQTFFPLLLGSVTEASGITVLTCALHQGCPITIAFMIALTGAETGLRFMPMTLHGIGFFPNNVASVVAMTSFAVPFGGTLAMTIMTSVFFNKARFSVNSLPGSSSGVQGMSSLPPDVRGAIQDKARAAILWAFISILPFMWVCDLAAASLGNVKITRRRKVDSHGQTGFSENTTKGAFLASFLKKWISGDGKGRHTKDIVNEKEEGVSVANAAQF